MSAKIIAFPGCSVTELEPEAVEATVVVAEAEFDEARMDWENDLRAHLDEVEQATTPDEWRLALTRLSNVTMFALSGGNDSA